MVVLREGEFDCLRLASLEANQCLFEAWNE